VTAAGSRSSLDADELRKFEAIAAEWWDPDGKFRPLHRLNPLRLGYIRDRAVECFDRDPRSARPLEGLRILDIGCGGGLLCEPLSRLGGEVVGIDPAAGNISVARLHAEKAGVAVDYRDTTAEALAEAGETFDIVLAMEVVEHVVDVPAFLATAAGMARPGGLFVMSTINRTLRAAALAIGAAEYVLRWLPRGTHDYRKFVTPKEATAALTGAGLALAGETGVVFSPLTNEWRLGPDMAVNYMLAAHRPAAD
jgi:2-polyprenyl-6-hydroxyphenyl methylase/3-demethylubiquinone-9 3-methyltransferase